MQYGVPCATRSAFFYAFILRPSFTIFKDFVKAVSKAASNAGLGPESVQPQRSWFSIFILRCKSKKFHLGRLGILAISEKCKIPKLCKTLSKFYKISVMIDESMHDSNLFYFMIKAQALVDLECAFK